MAAYSIADEPAVTQNVELQDIGAQQQSQPQGPPAPPPQSQQVWDEQRQRFATPQPPQQQPQQQQQAPPKPPQPTWNRADQDMLNGFTATSLSLQKDFAANKYHPEETQPGGPVSLLRQSNQQVQQLTQKKAAFDAAQQQQQKQAAMDQAALQQSIVTVHKTEDAKTFPQTSSVITDPITGQSETFYQHKPGEWKPVEWKQQQAQSENGPAIYNKMSGQEYQQSLGDEGGQQAAQRIGQSLGQGGHPNAGFEQEAYARAAQQLQGSRPRPTGNRRIDGQAEMEWQNRVSRLANIITQHHNAGETLEQKVEGQQSVAGYKSTLKKSEIELTHQLRQQKQETEANWWKLYNAAYTTAHTRISKDNQALAKADPDHVKIASHEDIREQALKEMEENGFGRSAEEYAKKHGHVSETPTPSLTAPSTTIPAPQAANPTQEQLGNEFKDFLSK